MVGEYGPRSAYADCPRSPLFADAFNPLPDEKILDWSKLKEIADDISKCIESEK